MPRIKTAITAALILLVLLASLTGPTAASASTTHYSCAQLGRLWLRIGGRRAAERIAEAVAMAESGGYRYARDRDANGTVDRGLWQINSIHGHWSSYNARTNARGARAISGNGRNWRPWVTYDTGAFRHHCGA